METGTASEVLFDDVSVSASTIIYYPALQRFWERGTILRCCVLACLAVTIPVARCEALMRMAEKELSEMDKKKSVASNAAKTDSGATVGVAANANSSAGTRERLSELSKHIAEEARRLALTRGELLKAKGGSSSVSAIVAMDSGSGVAKPKAAKPRMSTENEKSDKSTSAGRPAKNLASENLPDLARYGILIDFSSTSLMFAAKDNCRCW